MSTGLEYGGEVGRLLTVTASVNLRVLERETHSGEGKRLFSVSEKEKPRSGES
jgi:hypothetical protein